MGDKRRQRPAFDDAYLPLVDLANYGGLSVPTLREWLTHPEHPLPHIRVGKIIVVKRSEYGFARRDIGRCVNLPTRA